MSASVWLLAIRLSFEALVGVGARFGDVTGYTVYPRLLKPRFARIRPPWA